MKLHHDRYKRKIALFLIVACLALFALTFIKLFLTLISTQQATQLTIAKQYIAIADNIANELDKDAYGLFMQDPAAGQNREQIKQYLETYRHSINALYVYTLELDETDVAKTTIAAIPPGIADLPFGYPCTVPGKQVNQAKKGGTYYTEVLIDETHGIYMSVGVPFYDSNGQPMGVLGIDIDVSELDNISKQVVKGNKEIFFLDVIFIILLLLITFMLHRWYKTSLKRDLKESETMYISELEKVISAIKSGRHDLMNHFQVVNGLISLKMYDKAADYMSQLKYDAKTLDLSLRVGNPVLLILFNSKWQLAQSKNVEVLFDTEPDDYNRIETMDLVKIFSNLLDNAIEATEHYMGDHPKEIYVVCKKIGSKYKLAVENPAVLSTKDQKSIFQQGYTTKENKHALRGNGLTIVTRTVEKYRGDIHFNYDDEKVSVQITL
ncbi:GHKL domain-containing protein [Paenibacillus sp. CAU 1782]